MKRKRDDEEDDEYISGAAPLKRHNSASGRANRSRVQPVPSSTRPAARPAASSATSPAVPSRLEATFRKTVDELHKNKPEPSAEPPVWAAVKAALNDAVPYFKKHQGSLYTQKLVAQGMLVDAEVGSRDKFLSQVIITSVGGGRVTNETTKKMVRVKDQSKEKSDYRFLNDAREKKLPIAMIADYFHVTDVWAEVVLGQDNKPVRIFMVRIEKINLDSRSWWTPKESIGRDAGEFKPGQYSCPLSTCHACRKESKKMYKQGWTCLNEECAQFFQFPAHIDVNELEYNDHFLNERTAFTGPQPKYDLIPALPCIKGDASGSEKEYKQGIVCPKCHGCSRKIQWNYWYCENRECDFKHTITVQMNSMEKIAEENAKIMAKRRTYKFRRGEKPSSLPLHFSLVIGGHRFTVFFLTDGTGRFIGSVTRIRPTKQARSRPGGYNDIYTDVQNSDIPFERRGARNAGCRIEELTSHWSANFGAPYKFGVVVKFSTPFRDAPLVILEIQKRLTWAGEEAIKATIDLIKEHNLDVVEGSIPTGFKPFNEQLVLGYFEESRISPHDDGEKELGPTVASLSKGGPSNMMFFPKRRSGIGHEKKAVLGLILKHGDMMVMHGALIQKNYNHSVDARGKHRFAMTCRYIRPEMIPDQEQRILAVENGTMPKEWDDIRYNGERDRLESITTGEEVLRPGST
ncbi:hypothetical protein K449DRAFT_377378 [Hypoxylon sp. EC38]|nr:hypothetical protein K449DRAFT_377378 [Hypoxylon sp. EC38]